MKKVEGNATRACVWDRTTKSDDGQNEWVRISTEIMPRTVRNSKSAWPNEEWRN